MTGTRGIFLGTTIFALVSIGTLHAQTPSAVFEVTYVEADPASEPAAVALLKKHRDVGRQEPGNVGLAVLQQDGRPGHFVILESWRDQAAFDRHAVSDATRGFLDALQALLVSPADQRVLKGLAVASAMNAPGEQAVYVVTHVDTIPNPQRDVSALLKRLAEESRNDDGNLSFQLLQQANRANHFTIVEVWKDRASVDRHAVAAHTRQYRSEIQPSAGSPIDERLFTALK
jgi:quinol monooxygenase YgiN